MFFNEKKKHSNTPYSGSYNSFTANDVIKTWLFLYLLRFTTKPQYINYCTKTIANFVFTVVLQQQNIVTVVKP